VAKYRYYSANNSGKADFYVETDDIEVSAEGGVVVVTISQEIEEDQVVKAVINLAPGERIERV